MWLHYRAKKEISLQIEEERTHALTVEDFAAAAALMEFLPNGEEDLKNTSALILERNLPLKG
jgi:hypothetical protein